MSNLTDKIRRSWPYRQLASLKTSVWLLGVLCVFFIIGTIFFQGGDLDLYEAANGRFIWAVRTFNLLNLFTTPAFLLAAFLLLLNLLVCTFERFLVITGLGPHAHAAFTPDYSIPLPHKVEDARIETARVMTEELGFKTAAGGGETDGWTVMHKGLSYRWLTWLYHLGIIICFAGFVLTGLMVREGTMTLRPGEPQAIEHAAPERLGWIEGDEPAGDFEIVLDEFITEYTERPKLDYPSDKLGRLLFAVGLKGLSYRLEDESFFPKDWKSRLRVIDEGRSAHEETIEVNYPMRYQGYTFYQFAFEQILSLEVDHGPDIIEARANGEIEVDGIDGRLKFGTFRTGTLFKLDGTTERIKPFVMVKRAAGDDEDETLGRLDLGGVLTIDGKTIRLTGAEERSIIGYRYDPGAAPLWAAGALVFVVMTLRCLGGWYLAAYEIERKGGASILKLHISTKGLGADREKIKNRLQHFLLPPG